MRETILLTRISVASLLALGVACESSHNVPLPPPPANDVTLASFAPDRGFSGDLVELHGSGFGHDLAAIEVLFNGYGARPEDVNDDGTVLRVRVPAGVASGQLTVVAPLGRATSSERFEYEGGGHLTRGAVSQTFHLPAGLGALQLRGDEVWALATTMHQLVRVDGTLERLRLDVEDPPVDISPVPDAWGRTVIATKRQVVALPIGTVAGPKLVVDLPTTELFRVVPLKNKAVMVLAAHAAFVVSLAPDAELPPAPDPLHDRIHEISPGDTGIARLIDGTVDDDGNIYLAAEDTLARPLVVASNPLVQRPKVLTAPSALAGPMVRVDTSSGKFLVAATSDGQLAVADLQVGSFATSTLDLLASGPALALYADPARETVYATVPASGRLVAVVDPQNPRIGWTVALGGTPRGMAKQDQRLLVANSTTNSVQFVDLDAHALLGEKHVDLGAGSPLGGRHGLDVVHLAATQELPAEDLAVVLSQSADVLVGLDPTTSSAREPAFLAPGARAFAASSEGFAVVSHADGSLGRVEFGHMRAAVFENVLCGSGKSCPGAVPIAMEVSGDKLLLVMPRSAQVRDAKTLAIVAERAAEADGFYAGGRFTGAGIALLWADKAAGAGTLAFIQAANPESLAGAQPVQREVAAQGTVLAPRGVASARSLGGSDVGSPVFLFLRNAALQPKPWGFAPEREAQTLVPTPNLGASPTFSPDGRQIAGLNVSADGLAASLLFVRGEFLAGEPLTPQAVADLPAIPRGFAYVPGGEKAVAVLGATDTLVLFE